MPWFDSLSKIKANFEYAVVFTYTKAVAAARHAAEAAVQVLVFPDR